MKYFSRKNEYKASNVRYEANTNEAYSYDWWCFFKTINGKNIFNAYSYSVTTNQHQRKVERLLSDLGIKVDVTVFVPGGLQSNLALKEAIEYNKNKIVEYTLKAKRARKLDNQQWHINTAVKYQHSLDFLETIGDTVLTKFKRKIAENKEVA